MNNLIADTKGFDFYLAKEVVVKVDSNPINELHLHGIPEDAVSVKMPSGYKMVFSTLLNLDGQNHYLVKRLSKSLSMKDRIQALLVIRQIFWAVIQHYQKGLQ